jgi:hypothetical protein
MGIRGNEWFAKKTNNALQATTERSLQKNGMSDSKRLQLREEDSISTLCEIYSGITQCT